MECYSEQMVSMFVDGELPADEARRLRDHLSGCKRCRQLLDALHAENRVLSESLQELPDEAISPPDFSPSRRRFAWAEVAIVAAVLAVGAKVAVWMNDLSIPQALQWLNPFSASGRTNLAFNFFYYIAHGGASMLDDYAAVIGKIFLLLLLSGSALFIGRRWKLSQPGLRLLILLLAFSVSGFALERRHSEVVTVGANQTIDDTLLATGNIVRVDGTVNGDLIVFSQSVEVRGAVKGDLISFANRTLVSGSVEGNIYNFSHSLDLEGQLGHSLYALTQSLRVNDHGRVGNGIVAAAGEITVEGDVTRSVTVAAGNTDVSGNIGRELTVASDNITLTSTARVGGSLTAHVKKTDDVHIADGATIAGGRNIVVEVKESRFARPRFYFYRAVWLAAAMLVGWLGMMLFPGFFQATTQAVGSGWRSLGIGIGVLAGVPLAVLVLAITLVGLPVSFMLLAMYLTALGLAKIWVGAFLGRMIVKPAAGTKSDWLLGLLVGLVILTIVGFVPYLGGLVRFAVLCIGLGAFSWQLYWVSRPARTA